MSLSPSVEKKAAEQTTLSHLLAITAQLSAIVTKLNNLADHLAEISDKLDKLSIKRETEEVKPPVRRRTTKAAETPATTADTSKTKNILQFFGEEYKKGTFEKYTAEVRKTFQPSGDAKKDATGLAKAVYGYIKANHNAELVAMHTAYKTGGVVQAAPVVSARSKSATASRALRKRNNSMPAAPPAALPPVVPPPAPRKTIRELPVPAKSLPPPPVAKHLEDEIEEYEEDEDVDEDFDAEEDLA